MQKEKDKKQEKEKYTNPVLTNHGKLTDITAGDISLEQTAQNFFFKWGRKNHAKKREEAGKEKIYQDGLNQT